MEAAELRSLIAIHQRMVFSIALRLTGDHGLAEEVAQDVFLELFQSTGKFDGDDHIRFWLRRVAVHRATDALRRRSRQPEAIAEEWVEPQQDTAVVQAGMAGVRPDILANIEDLLVSLPEPMRIAMVLRYQEEMASAEIATLLGQPIATVKSNLQRGLQLLRKKAMVAMKGARDERIRHEA